MQRLLTGIKPTGDIHLGNYLGCFQNVLKLQDQHNCLIFIPDLHGLTTVQDGTNMQKNTLKLAAALIALGLDYEKHIFYKQSAIPEVCELTWILSCLTPHGLLERAHAYKDALNKKKDINAGIFIYPILMAADILLYNAEIIPVGKDQKQHLEIARDLAHKFNHNYGETFVIPETYIQEDVETVIGLDGQKMSKSYNNVIPIFLPDADIKKAIMSIASDSKTLEEPKDPNTCNIFKLYSYLATAAEIQELKAKYQAGNFGYGEAKKMLLHKFHEKFDTARAKYQDLITKPEKINAILEEGAQKARQIAKNNLEIIRKKIGVK